MSNLTLIKLKRQLYSSFFIPILLCSIFVAGYCLPTVVQAQANQCNQITFSFTQYEPCKFRLTYNNASECYNEIRLALEQGSFLNWSVNAPAGFMVQVISPSELWITHSNGFIPLGMQGPLLFSLPVGLVTTVDVAYLNYCPPGVGCALFPGPVLESCPDPNNASIIGVKYRECNAAPYTNQPTVANWAIQLLNVDGAVISEQTTGNDGTYAFYDLPAGQYIVKEASQPGWTPSVPASGQTTINLAASQQASANFGNCQKCACDSIHFSVKREVGTNDSCCYNLSVKNTAPGNCFSFINVSLITGSFSGWTTLLPGWTVTPIDGQHIRLNPPTGGLLVTSIPLRFCITGAAIQTFEIAASYNSGTQSLNCPQTFTYACPAPISDCCPQGAIKGPELVDNGDFEGGAIGFTSDYLLLNPTCSPGKYNVVASPPLATICNNWGGVDHTSGASTGKMFVADGSQIIGQAAWRQTMAVEPLKKYTLCAWINNLNVPSFDRADPIIEVYIKDGANVSTLIAGPTTLPETPDSWVNITGMWTAPAVLVAPYRLEFRTASTSFEGNNFAIDDISFRTCGQIPCVADFNFQNINSCGKVQFTSTSTGTGLTYAWSFGDSNGGTSTLQNPMYQFNACGTYTVCLTITGPNCMKTICKQVSVVDNVNPVITCRSDTTVFATVLPCSKLVNGLDFLSVTDNCFLQVTSYTVSGATTNFGQNSASGLTYNSGVSTITYTAKDWCGNTATCSFKVTVFCDTMKCACPGEIPGSNLITNGSFSAGNAGFSSGLTFDNNAGCSTGFYGLDANFNTFCGGWQNLPAHTPPLFMTLDGSSASGATVLWQTPVNLVANMDYCFSFWWALGFQDAQQNFPISIDIVNAAGVVVSNSSANVGTETIMTQLNWTQKIVSWNSGTLAGPHYIAIRQLTGGAYRDWGIDDICLRKKSSCTADFNFQNIGCGKVQFNGFANGTPGYSYAWNFGDPNSGVNNTATIQNPMHQFSAAGTYTITLIITDATGCKATYSNTITIPPFLSSVTLGPPNPIVCAGDCITLTATGVGANVVSCQWNNGQNGASITVCPTVFTTYCVTCTDANGCTASNCVAVEVKPKPAANAGPNKTICVGQSTTLTATGGGTYVWLPGGQNTAAITVSPTVSTIYTVTVTGVNGCTGTASVTVTVFPNPILAITGKKIICPGECTVLTASATGSNLTNCQWNTSQNTPSISVCPLTNTTYSVTCTDGNGCTGTASTTVTVLPVSLTAGLNGYFPFNETSFTDDVSTTNIDGVPTNILPALAPNNTNSAYNFNGTNSWVDATNSSRGVTDKVSVCAWVKTTESQRGMWIAGQYVGGGQPKGYLLSIGNVNNNLIGQTGFSGRVDANAYSSATAGTGAKVNDGAWHCIVGIAGNNTWSVYVDGNLEDTQPGPTAGGIGTTSAPFTIGRVSDLTVSSNSMRYNGDMDDVRVYNRMLNECEIDSICSLFTVSETGSLINVQSFNLFPNPNTGQFTLELPQPATTGMTFRISDLTGRLLLEKRAEPGSMQQQIQVTSLPNGLYFLQVVSDNKVLGVQRFVKQ